jgi:hypothetical protein
MPNYLADAVDRPSTGTIKNKEHFSGGTCEPTESDQAVLGRKNPQSAINARTLQPSRPRSFCDFSAVGALQAAEKVSIEALFLHRGLA